MTLGLRLSRYRQVEKISQGKISNAYLSQLETGRVKKPSPTVLFVLAEVLDCDYTDLMSLAGYYSPNQQVRVATHNWELTKEEETKLAEYLEFLRYKETL